MKVQLGDVRAFHRKFRSTYEGPPRDLPGEISLPLEVISLLEEARRWLMNEPIENEKSLRAGLLVEEVAEYVEALVNGDLAEQLDALVDSQYILTGAVLKHGFGHIYPEAWGRVHEANMAKVLVENQYKIGKPEGWKPPTFSDLLLLKGD